MSRRRLWVPVLVGSLILGLVPAPAAGAAGSQLPHIAEACGPGVPGDIDGNGVADLVIAELRLSFPTSGRETDFDVIRYPGEQRVAVGVPDLDPGTTSGSINQAALGDLNADGCADVVFAADEGATPGVRLYVVPGSTSGLALDRSHRIDVAADLVQRVAVLPHASASQIAVTTRSENGDQALHIVTLDSALDAVQTTTITAASLGIRPYENSRFGFGRSLAASGRTIVVGNPHEWRTGHRYLTGAVHLFTSTDAAPTTFRHSRISQDSPHIPGRGLDGTSFGEQVDYLDGRLVVAAPDTQIVRKSYYANNAGQLFLLRWKESTRTYTYLRRINQNTKGVPGTAEPWERLGYQVLLARGLSAPGAYDLVASSREGIGAADLAGSVLVTNFDKGGYRNLTQATQGVPGDVGENQWFGYVLARRAGASSDVLVLASISPGETCDTGILMQTSGLPLATTTWTLVPPRTDDLPCPTGFWPELVAR